MDIHSAARLAGMSSDEFIALNAAFPRKLIRSDTPVNLLIPVDKADKFQRNLRAPAGTPGSPMLHRKANVPKPSPSVSMSASPASKNTTSFS